MQQERLAYYAEPGLMTQVNEQQAAWLGEMPQDIPGLVQLVQNLNIHIFWASRYGLSLSPEREAEVQLRRLPERLMRIQALDPRPWREPRTLDDKLVSNCRDFSLFFTGLLRSLGIPARARCGFGIYFMPGHFEDHWVVEVWNAVQQRWVWVDAQLDALMCQTMKVPFDPLDMPPQQFVTGGQAWLMCRRGEANPDDFGIFDMHGWDFIRGNVLRDFLALNKIELLPWDQWGLLNEKPVALCSGAELAQLDTLAELSVNPDLNWVQICAAYAGTPALHIPPEW